MNHKQFEALRAKIVKAQAEQAALQAQETSRDDVATAVREWADREHAAFVKHARLVLRCAAAGQSLHAPMRGAPLAFGGVDIGQALAGILGPDALAAALLQHIDVVPEGMGAAERAERLAALQADLDDLEAREEAAIVESEATEHPCRRRPDARPEIVLALPGVPA